MEAVKVILHDREFIIPFEYDGMCIYRGWATEIVDVEEIPNIMEDLIAHDEQKNNYN